MKGGNKMSEVFEGKGIIGKKEQAKTKAGAIYYKFVINGKTYNLFDENLANGINVDDKVGFFYTTKDSEWNGKQITYRNLSNIHLVDSVEMIDVKDTPPKQVNYRGDFEKTKSERMTKLGCLRDAIQVLTAQLEAKQITEIKQEEVFELAELFRNYVEKGDIPTIKKEDITNEG